MAISELYGKDIRYCSNRKEVKDHGDTGILLGSPIKDGDKVVIIEDVTTSGKSIEETFPIIKAQGDVEIKGLMVSLNRMERGKGTRSALDEIKDLYRFSTAAIVSMADVVEHLYNKEINGKVVIDDQIKADVYKRQLCSYLGELVERGEYFSGEKYLKEIIEGICYRNVKEYFGW